MTSGPQNTIITMPRDEYIENPLSFQKAEKMRQRARVFSGVIWVLTVVFTAVMVAIFGFGTSSVSVGFLAFIVAAIPALFAAIRVTEYWQSRAGQEVVFIIGGQTFYQGSVATAFDFIDEPLDRVRAEYKAPDALKLLDRIQDNGRLVMKCEKLLLNKIEDDFIESLYQAA